MYDEAGRLTSETDNGATTSYAYNAAGELTQAGSVSYTYDLNGNPTGSGISIGPDNQLQTDAGLSYTYDADGNQATAVNSSAGTSWTYTYNTKDQMLTAVETETGAGTVESVSYSYDVFGNRVSESVTQGGTTTPTQFVYLAGGTLYATLDGSGDVQTRYVSDVQGPDNWEAQVSASAGVQWLLSDRQGSVRVVTTVTGTVVDTNNYDAFGNASNATFSCLLGFQGMVYDTAIGQNVTPARAYNPGTGRWDALDPTGFAGGESNLYEFAGNGPTNATDPSGLEPKLIATQTWERGKYGVKKEDNYLTATIVIGLWSNMQADKTTNFILTYDVHPAKDSKGQLLTMMRNDEEPPRFQLVESKNDIRKGKGLVTASPTEEGKKIERISENGFKVTMGDYFRWQVSLGATNAATYSFTGRLFVSAGDDLERLKNGWTRERVIRKKEEVEKVVAKPIVIKPIDAALQWIDWSIKLDAGAKAPIGEIKLSETGWGRSETGLGWETTTIPKAFEKGATTQSDVIGNPGQGRLPAKEAGVFPPKAVRPKKKE